MLDKIKTLIKNTNWQQLRDVRLLGFIVFGVLVLLASWSGLSVIETNYQLLQEVSQLEQQNKVQELTNTNLKLKNEYYNTDTYLELTARKQFGKGAPGETLILVPKSVALAHTKELPADKPAPTAVQEPDKPTYQKNLQAWMDFFFHHPIDS